RLATIIGLVAARGERILRPSLTTFEGPKHLLIAGAPGNGKTTISRFLIQIFRSAMLNGAIDTTNEHRKVIEGTHAALKRLGVTVPRNRRWAMRIDLAAYASSHGGDEDSTIVRYLAERISKRSNTGELRASALKSW